MRVSFCIPTHDGNAKCQNYLFDIFHALSQQTNKDFNVWISDHSESNKVLDACKEYADLFEINYIKNTKKYGNISANTNHALQHADGDILKVLFSDDFILTCNLVAELDKAFTDDVHWAVTGYAHTVDDGHTHYNPKIPYHNDKLLEGVNTLSSPSILALKRGIDMYFDEDLTMLMDCDMYYRLYKYHGEPVILKDYHISNREHKSQTQRTYEHLLPEEIEYLKQKHSS
jgi:glycosyltransferase involved in cell wall biosynthesis